MMWYHEALLQYSAADYTELTWMNWKNILIKKRIFLILHISRAGFLVTMMLGWDMDSQWVFIQSSSSQGRLA